MRPDRTLLNTVPGWGATVVPDAAAAVAVAGHVRVDLLVVGLDLPGISGQALLERWPAPRTGDRPPAVVTTTAPRSPALQEAVAAGWVTAVVRKPFDGDALIAVVQGAAAPAERAP